MIQVVDADTWEDVQRGAKVGFSASMSPTCIYLGRPNHDKAAHDFMVFANGEDIRLRYFLILDSGCSVIGYIRALVVGSAGDKKSWILDFVTPFSHGACLIAARKLDGTVFVSDRVSDDRYIGDNWPVVVVAFPRLNEFSYHRSSGYEGGTWKMVSG